MDRDLLEAIRLVIREEIRVNDERLLTPEELAERLKVPISWVYENSRLGRLTFRRPVCRDKNMTSRNRSDSDPKSR
jgi:hypothetical protein